MSDELREPMGIIMADIDYFQKVNDSHGHLVGDAVLREVTGVCSPGSEATIGGPIWRRRDS